jgi:hypothetical protein
VRVTCSMRLLSTCSLGAEDSAVKIWPFGSKDKSTPGQRVRDYLRDIRMAASSLPFTGDSGWHRELAIRPEALCYISRIAAHTRQGMPWTSGAWMPFSAGLVAGIRLASEPASSDEQIEAAFKAAVKNFPRPDQQPDRHDEMAHLYEQGLREEESKQGYSRASLLDIECKRDPRAESYAYQPFEVDNASESTIAAFQAGLLAGARLLALGDVQRAGH